MAPAGLLMYSFVPAIQIDKITGNIVKQVTHITVII